MAACDDIRELFSPFLDGELPSGERAAVEAHLSECSACLRELSRFQKVTDLYRGMPVVAAPSDFEEAVARAIRPQPVVLAKRRRMRRNLWPLFAAAAGLLLMAIPTYLTNHRPGPAHDMQLSKAEYRQLPGSAASPSLAQEPDLELYNESRRKQDIRAGETTAALEALGYLDSSNAPAAAAPAEAMPPEAIAGGKMAEAKAPQAKIAAAVAEPAPPAPAVVADEMRGDSRALGNSAAGGIAEKGAAPATPEAPEQELAFRSEGISAAGARARTARSASMPEVAQRRTVQDREESKPETRAAAARTFVLVKGVWQQENYAGETTVALVKDSDRFKMLLEKHPEIGQIVGLGPRVIFSLNDLWYTLQPADSKQP